MKTILNYFKKRREQNKISFYLNCKTVYIEASSLTELCDKVNASQAKQGISATKIVAGVVFISTAKS